MKTMELIDTSGDVVQIDLDDDGNLVFGHGVIHLLTLPKENLRKLSDFILESLDA